MRVAAVLVDRGEVAVEVAVGGAGLEVEAGVLGQRELDVAVAVLDIDIAKRQRAGQVDGSVAVGDGDVSGDAVERDVAAMRVEVEGAKRLVNGEAGAGADVDLAIKTGELEVGAAGVEANISVDMFEVGAARRTRRQG